MGGLKTPRPSSGPQFPHKRAGEAHKRERWRSDRSRTSRQALKTHAPGAKPRWSPWAWAAAGGVVWLLLGGLLACQTGPGDSQDAPAAADQAEQGPSPVAVLASLIHQLGTPASPDPTEENQVAALEPAEGLNEGQPIKEGPETKNAPPEPPQEVAEGLEGPEAPAELESPAVPAAPPATKL